MNKRDCKIVQDLLPNYIEKLTDEETNKYVEEHIKECEECKNVLENMKKDIKSNDEKRDVREVKYMKKFKNKIRILKFIILLIVLILFLLFAVIIGKRFIILTDISEKAQENNYSANFHILEYYYYEGNLIKMEQYRLDDKIKFVYTQESDDGIIIQTEYGQKCQEEYSEGNYIYTGNIYLNKENEKYMTLNTSVRGPEEEKLKSVLYENNYLDYLKYSLNNNIAETKFCGKDCYYLTNIPSYLGGNYERVYIDKETGLMIGSTKYDNTLNINEGDIMTMETIYEYGTVTDEDFVEPDGSEYKEVENIYQVMSKLN